MQTWYHNIRVSSNFFNFSPNKNTMFLLVIRPVQWLWQQEQQMCQDASEFQEKTWSSWLIDHRYIIRRVFGYPSPIGSMGLVYIPTWMVDFYGKNVGKYTSPMDPMGPLKLTFSHLKSLGRFLEVWRLRAWSFHHGNVKHPTPHNEPPKK